jgi:protein-tyrosine kinase
MKRIPEAWRKIETQGPAHKGNGSDAEAIEEMVDADPMVFRLATEGAVSQPHNGAETTLEQFCLRNWNPDPKTMLFFEAQEPAAGQEDFRLLRSRLYQVRENMPLKTVLVASSLAKEGRSFVAINLAQAMARQQACRVLLLDADLRSPSLHLTLGTSDSPGLSEYLLSEVEHTRIIQKGQLENLYFIPSGRLVSGQTEIVSNGRLKTLLEQLGAFFDWIIIDSPAALPVSDAGLISNFCDGALIVVRSNSTPFDTVRKARERFREDRILGVVLNGISGEGRVENRYYRTASANESNPNGKWK